jgi:hypothetical protein
MIAFSIAALLCFAGTGSALPVTSSVQRIATDIPELRIDVAKDKNVKKDKDKKKKVVKRDKPKKHAKVIVKKKVVVRPVRPWVRRAYFGTIIGGVVLGSIIAATVVPPVPAPSLCWYWTTPYRAHGYWDYCTPPY